jgi:hypothetical protein
MLIVSVITPAVGLSPSRVTLRELTGHFVVDGKVLGRDGAPQIERIVGRVILCTPITVDWDVIDIRRRRSGVDQWAITGFRAVFHRRNFAAAIMIPVTTVNVQENSKRSIASPAMIRSHTQAAPSRSGLRPLLQRGGKATATCLNLGGASQTDGPAIGVRGQVGKSS